MIKIVAGVILLLIGFGGIAGNIVFAVTHDGFDITLIINSVVCLVFIYAGARLFTSGRAGSGMPKRTDYKGFYK